MALQKAISSVDSKVKTHSFQAGTPLEPYKFRPLGLQEFNGIDHLLRKIIGGFADDDGYPRRVPGAGFRSTRALAKDVAWFKRAAMEKCLRLEVVAPRS